MRALFAKDVKNLSLTDGVLTGIDLINESEWLAFLSLPADLLKSYTAALGATFDAFKSTDDKEAQALEQSLKLELAKIKYQACLDALKQGNTQAVESLKCNGS